MVGLFQLLPRNGVLCITTLLQTIHLKHCLKFQCSTPITVCISNKRFHSNTTSSSGRTICVTFLLFIFQAYFPRPSIQSLLGNSVRFTVSADVTQQLQILARNSSTTLFHVLLSIFGIAVGKCSQQCDFGIGIPAVNRTSQTANTLGLFTNVSTFRHQHKEDQTFLDLLEQSKKALAEVISHSGVQMNQILEVLHQQTTSSRNPLWQVSFSLLSRSMLEIPPFKDLKIMNVSKDFIPTTTTMCDLTAEVLELEDNTLHWTLEFSTDLFTKNVIERFGHFLGALMKELTASPNLPVNKLASLSPVSGLLDTRIAFWKE